MANEQVTRGHGILEPFLARQRAKQANRLIPAHLRAGRILDIGCGSSPYFLSHTSFEEKFAVDQLSPAGPDSQVKWHVVNLSSHPQLPFEDGYFTAVTMLAVVEHLDPIRLVELFTDIRRIMQPGGVLILTTPASWSDGLLRWMACVRLVSPEEIHEHVFAYTLPLLGWYFGRAGFGMNKIHFGYFEFHLNMWATAEK